MVRPPYLSPSAWSSWDKCPYAWAKRYIHGADEPPTAAMLAGTIMHWALEHLMISPKRQRTTADLAVIAKQSFEVHAEQIAGLLDASPDPDTVKAELHKIVRESVAAAETTEHTTFAEAKVVSVEQTCDLEVAGVPVRLIIDRIDVVETANGPIGVAVDYKTGKPSRGAYHRQMVLSAIAAENLLEGEIPFPTAELRHVRHGKVVVIDATPSVRREVERDLRATWRQIAACEIDGDFPTKPSPLCAWCAHLNDCPDPSARTTAGPYLKRAGR